MCEIPTLLLLMMNSLRMFECKDDLTLTRLECCSNRSSSISVFEFPFLNGKYSVLKSKSRSNLVIKLLLVVMFIFVE